MNHFNQDPAVPNSPCKDCKDRYFGCHDVCRVYKEWAAKMRELNKKRRMESRFANCTLPEARLNEREQRRKKKNRLLGQR